MAFSQWLTRNWFTLLQSIGIVASLVFNATALRADTKSRRVTNLIAITTHHREIWAELYDRPELARVLELDPDLKNEPVTREEEIFTRTLILHLNGAYHAIKDGMLVEPDGLGRDIQSFFALPIPGIIWEELKPLQDIDFVQFVERYRR